jgi:hypothetical protein
LGSAALIILYAFVIAEGVGFIFGVALISGRIVPPGFAPWVATPFAPPAPNPGSKFLSVNVLGFAGIGSTVMVAVPRLVATGFLATPLPGFFNPDKASPKLFAIAPSLMARIVLF